MSLGAFCFQELYWEGGGQGVGQAGGPALTGGGELLRGGGQVRRRRGVDGQPNLSKAKLTMDSVAAFQGRRSCSSEEVAA